VGIIYLSLHYFNLFMVGWVGRLVTG